MSLKKIAINLLCGFIPFERNRRVLRGFLSGKARNNQIIFVKNGKQYKKRFWNFIPGLSIKIAGNNNKVILVLPIKAINSQIDIDGDNCHVEIGKTDKFYNVKIHLWDGDNQILTIGDNTTIRGAEFRMANSNTMIKIGINCMFSWGISIFATDSHTIFDKDTKEILNKQKEPLIIGDNCWIANNVIFTKNAQIPDNTIIGMFSLVSKKFTEPFTIIAGNPAKIVKQNVSWTEKEIYLVEKNV